MKSNIDIDNGYYFKIVDNLTTVSMEATDISKLKLSTIIKKEKILLSIDFDKLNKNYYKRLLNKILFIKKISIKDKIGIEENGKILLGYCINYNENDKQHNNLILGINTVFYNTRYERYNFIYDYVCNYLDGKFYEMNLCDFKDNRCRKGTASTLTGCCSHFKHKFLAPISKLVPCEYLKSDKTCGAKCISCKLFTCDYLEKKGIKFKIKDIFLLDTFFNPLQKYCIKYMVFTPKEKILKRLMLL